MIITDFNKDHVERAQALVMQNYEEERSIVSALPVISQTPDLRGFADNGLGVAAFDGEKMAGFLCCVSPFQNAFGSTDAVGVFSPMGANGATVENRAKIYARMYQAAGEKWVKSGALSHAVCLYAHDKEAHEQFFRYGFGLRCVDAIRGMEPISCTPREEYDFMELGDDEYQSVHVLHLLLYKRQCSSPFL